MIGRACTSALLLAFIVSCGDASDTSGVPVGFAVPAAGESARCREALAVASTEACRGIWVCADARTLGLACLRGENSSSCACTLAIDEESESSAGGVGEAGGAGGDPGTLLTFETADPCTTPEELRALAIDRCEIEVSP